MVHSSDSMEIPSRRPRSYISSYSVDDSTVVTSPLHKAESDKELNKNKQRQYLRSHSQEAATLQRAVSTSPTEFDVNCEATLENLRNDLLTPFKKKYSSVTVPSVRYSTMATRPRSPKKSAEPVDRQLEQQKMQDELDQSLLRIREQLGMLSSERLGMEKQMDDLTNDIHEARIQCHNQCRNTTGIRRVRSSTYSPLTPTGKRRASPSLKRIKKKSESSSSTLLSPDSAASSPEYIVQGHKSLGFTDSGYGSLNRRSKSIDMRVRAISIATSTPNVSLSQGNDYNPTIPELPEAPSSFSQPALPHKQVERIKSNPTLHYVSNTAPRHYRSHSTSIIAPPIINITSSPDLSTRGKSDNKLYHRNSLPESAMNKIVEGEIDEASVSDSLSQASLSQLTDEGSPKSQGSTVIVRRSSLTGQVEHVRRPRKRNSCNDFVDGVFKADIGVKSSSTFNLTATEYRVLNTGFKRNRKNKVILPNSVETTV